MALSYGNFVLHGPRLEQLEALRYTRLVLQEQAVLPASLLAAAEELGKGNGKRARAAVRGARAQAAAKANGEVYGVRPSEWQQADKDDRAFFVAAHDGARLAKERIRSQPDDETETAAE